MEKNEIANGADLKIASWLREVFEFLSEHRGYNFELQRKYYASIALGSDTAARKLLSLVWKVAQTQSGGDIDRLGWTLFHLENITNQCVQGEKIDLGKWLVAIANEMPRHIDHEVFSKRGREYFQSREFERSYETSPWRAMTDLFEAIPGLGFKTGRLLAKSIYHCGSPKLRYLTLDQAYLTNVPKLDESDLIQLPVDRVIINIFELVHLKKGIGFNMGNDSRKIARTIERCCSGGEDGEGKGLYSGLSSEVWDDLWFWGFISQKGSGNNREHAFNLNKYLCLEFARRDECTLKELKGLSDKFVALCSKT